MPPSGKKEGPSYLWMFHSWVLGNSRTVCHWLASREASTGLSSEPLTTRHELASGSLGTNQLGRHRTPKNHQGGAIIRSKSGKTETPTEAKWKCISPHLICRGAGTQRILDPDSQLIVQPKERRPPAWWSCDCPWGIWPAFPRRKLYREVLPSIASLPFPDRLALSHHIKSMLRLAICSYSLMKPRWLVIPLNKPSVECCLHLRRQITDGWDMRSDSSFGCLVGWSSLPASDCERVLHIHSNVPLG